MFRIDAGKTAAYCDGLSRRSFLQLGGAGMASATLGEISDALRGVFGEQHSERSV